MRLTSSGCKRDQKINTVENYRLWWSDQSERRSCARMLTRDVCGRLAGHFCNWGRSLARVISFNCSIESAPFATANMTYIQSPAWFLASELPHTSQLRHHTRKNVPCNLSGQNHPSYVDVRGSKWVTSCAIRNLFYKRVEKETDFCMWNIIIIIIVI